MKTNLKIAAAVGVTAFLLGCGGGEEPVNSGGAAALPTPAANMAEGSGSNQGAMKELAEVLASAEAGITLMPPTMTVNVIEEAKNANVGRMRYDAFALLPEEKSFDRKQEAARLVTDMGGGFSLIYQAPPEPVDEEMTVEPQPYRRLSGVLLGEGVIAIIEMEDGKTYMVRPGQQVGNTEWTCIALDTDKAILRRPGNKRPKEIFVRLESRPVGGSRAGGGGGGSNVPAGSAGQSGAGQAGERSPDN